MDSTVWVGEICGNLEVMGQNCTVMHNSQALVEFMLIVAIAISQFPGGAE